MDRHREPISTVPGVTRVIRRLKLLSMGDPGVGKSCLIKRYCTGQFSQEYVSTIGIDYGVKTVQMNGDEVKVNFWDAAGDPMYYDIRNEFYKDTHIAMLVCDVTKRKTFDNAQKWIEELKAFEKTEVLLFLLGNKIELPSRQVSSEDANLFAQKMNAFYFEVSAATGENVANVFDGMFQAALNKYFTSDSAPQRPLTDHSAALRVS